MEEVEGGGERYMYETPDDVGYMGRTPPRMREVWIEPGSESERESEAEGGYGRWLGGDFLDADEEEDGMQGMGYLGEGLEEAGEGDRKSVV